MKLIYLTATLPTDRGEAFLIPEVKELLRRGCQLRIVPRSPTKSVVHQDAEELVAHAATRPALSWDIAGAALQETLFRPGKVLRALTLIFRSRDWKTLLKNLAVYPKGLWLAAVARDFGADHIHAHWLSTPATMAMIASEVSGIPWSCTAHRVDIDLDNLLSEKLARAQFVRFISESGLRMAASLGAKPDLKNSPVIHVGVDMPPVPDSPPATAGRATLLCPANLYPVKGHKHLVDAMGLLRSRAVECRLLIAGAGELASELEEHVRLLGLDDMVQFLGQRSHTDILATYRTRNVDIVVLPSVDLGHNLHEGIPVSLMEAMSYAIPVISTRTGGIPELLGGDAGLLVPDKDPQALSDAIERLVASPALRTEIGRKGRERIRESFHVEAVVSELLSRISAEERFGNRKAGTADA